MKRSGFTLIELLFSVLIGSIMIAGLFSALFQISSVQISVDSITAVHQRAAIALTVLERDLMGIFIPEQVAPIQRSEKEEQKKESLTKIFWAKTYENKNIETLTFITNNPLEIYLGVKDAVPKPRVARVVYRMSPQQGVKDSFVLTRQEGEELFYTAYKKQTEKNKAYEILTDIASLTFSYASLDEQKNKDAKKREYKESFTWNSEKKSESKKSEGVQYLLPEYVTVKLELWDNEHEKKSMFEYIIPILFKKGKTARKKNPVAPLPVTHAQIEKNIELQIAKKAPQKATVQHAQVTNLPAADTVTQQAVIESLLIKQDAS